MSSAGVIWLASKLQCWLLMHRSWLQADVIAAAHYLRRLLQCTLPCGHAPLQLNNAGVDVYGRQVYVNVRLNRFVPPFV